MQISCTGLPHLVRQYFKVWIHEVQRVFFVCAMHLMQLVRAILHKAIDYHSASSNTSLIWFSVSRHLGPAPPHSPHPRTSNRCTLFPVDVYWLQRSHPESVIIDIEQVSIGSSLMYLVGSYADQYLLGINTIDQTVNFSTHRYDFPGLPMEGKTFQFHFPLG